MYALLPCVKERAASEVVSATALLHDYGSSVGLQKVETYEPPLPTSRRFLDRQHLHGGQPAANEVASLCLCVSVGLSVSLYACTRLSVCRLSAVCLPAVCLSVCLSVYLSVYMSVCLAGCMSVYVRCMRVCCLSVYLSVCARPHQ